MQDLKDGFYFLLRHIPFWTIPLGLVCIEIGILFWVKEQKKRFYYTAACGVVFFIILIFYYWQGGPDGSVRFFSTLDI